MNIDLTKILKDCPKGTKLYSTIFGEVEFVRISGENSHPVILKAKDESVINVDSEGKHFSMYEGECTLFPSREQRDWSKFTAPWYKKEKASLQTNNRAWLYLVSDVLTWKDGIGQYLDDQRVQELAKKLRSKYAQKLYNPSVLSSSSNTGKNEQKFDSNTLKPFDKVLVRDNKWKYWVVQLFSHVIEGELHYPYLCINNSYKYCIPYNEDTKHLVGTTEEAPEFYRY